MDASEIVEVLRRLSPPVDEGRLVDVQKLLESYPSRVTNAQMAMAAALVVNPSKAGGNIQPGTISQDVAAEIFGISNSSVSDCKQIREAGDKSLIAKVEKGEMAIAQAVGKARVITLSSGNNGRKSSLERFKARRQSQLGITDDPGINAANLLNIMGTDKAEAMMKELVELIGRRKEAELIGLGPKH